jgi:hypothetical protein
VVIHVDVLPAHGHHFFLLLASHLAHLCQQQDILDYFIKYDYTTQKSVVASSMVGYSIFIIMFCRSIDSSCLWWVSGVRSEWMVHNIRDAIALAALLARTLEEVV